MRGSVGLRRGSGAIALAVLAALTACAPVAGSAREAEERPTVASGPAPSRPPARPAPPLRARRVRRGAAHSCGAGRAQAATVDVLPPPADGRFASTSGPIPADVLARSTWSPACPVPVADLRYLTVSFRGFDGAVHTGAPIVTELFAAGFPLEEMRVVASAELDAAPTGDANTTTASSTAPLSGSPAGPRTPAGSRSTSTRSRIPTAVATSCCPNSHRPTRTAPTSGRG